MTDEPKLLRVPKRFATVADVLETARQLDLPNCLVLSELTDGRVVFLESNDMSAADANWLLDRVKMILLAPSAFERGDKP